MSECVWSSPVGTFCLYRYPNTHQSGGQLASLQAWDAADNYVVEHVVEHIVEPVLATMNESELNAASSNPVVRGRVLILNDHFGALSIALSAAGWGRGGLFSVSDSYLSQRGLQNNIERNQASLITPIELLTSTESLTKPLPVCVELVVLKLPKTLSLLEYQLHQLRSLVSADTTVIAAGMVKAWPKSAQALFERILGPSHTSLAKKKARLLFCKPQSSNHVAAMPALKQRYEVDVLGFTFTVDGLPNVFSRDSLDIGARAFLDALANDPDSCTVQQVVDLGCGNGVLSIAAGVLYPSADLISVDESYLAVASAEENLKRAFPNRSCRVEAMDCLESLADNSVDRVLNNPPFHQLHAVGDHIATQMFLDAKRVLKCGGELWVVGNRHLGYQATLTRLFGLCEQVLSTSKFVVLRCRKR